jgi:hypothetical protein
MYIHYVGRLVRKQIYITEEQNEGLRRAAVREGRPEAEIIRSALDARLGPKRGQRFRLADDGLWDIVGLGSSERDDDASERVDDFLYPPLNPGRRR